MSIKEIAGAYHEDDVRDGELIECVLSASREQLFELRRVSYGYQVTKLHKQCGAPSYTGFWWTPQNHGFGAASFEEAREYVDVMCQDIDGIATHAATTHS
jgi:hypothetical protein